METQLHCLVFFILVLVLLRFLDLVHNPLAQHLTLVLDYSRNSVVLRNLSHSIQKRGNYYSLLLENVLQRRRLFPKKDLVHYIFVEHPIQKSLRLQNNRLEEYLYLEKLLLQERQFILDLDPSRNSLVQQNPLPSIQKRSNFYSPLQERVEKYLLLILQKKEQKFVYLVQQNQKSLRLPSNRLEEFLYLVLLLLVIHQVFLDLVLFTL